MLSGSGWQFEANPANWGVHYILLQQEVTWGQGDKTSPMPRNGMNHVTIAKGEFS